MQLIGGLVLYEGKIAEMATGEGKTFVAPLACFMRVLEGLHCHVVTVNDYLVRRDAQVGRPAFENLGMTVGYIQSDMEPGGETRKAMYECDITYGTNSEFGFDYLRDNMKERADLQVQGPLDFAIVDEVDSILIDEARTPLIISGAAHDDAPKYRAADAVARKVIELNKPWDAVEKHVDAAKRAIKAAEGDEDKAKDKDGEGSRPQTHRAEAEKQLDEAEKKKEGLDAVLRGGAGSQERPPDARRHRRGAGCRRRRAVLRRQQHGVAAPDGAVAARPRGLRDATRITSSSAAAERRDGSGHRR